MTLIFPTIFWTCPLTYVSFAQRIDGPALVELSSEFMDCMKECSLKTVGEMCLVRVMKPPRQTELCTLVTVRSLQSSLYV